EGLRPAEGAHRDLPRRRICGELPAQAEDRGGGAGRPCRQGGRDHRRHRPHRPDRRRQDLRLQHREGRAHPHRRDRRRRPLSPRYPGVRTMTFKRYAGAGAGALALSIVLALPALAQTAAPEAATEAPAAAAEFASAKDTAFIFNTLLFLMGGFLVMWMAAGFAMLEAGLVRTKNVSMQCLQNVALFAVARLRYLLAGY